MCFFFSSRRRHTRYWRDWSSDVCSSDLGNVWKVLVEAGQKVEEGQLVTIIEAMKMENEITAHKAGVIAELPIKEGVAVAAGDTLAVIKAASEGDSSNGASGA